MVSADFDLIMEEIITALREAGYDPREQIHQYIQTGNPQYITRRNDARNKIVSLNTAEVWRYIKSI